MRILLCMLKVFYSWIMQITKKQVRKYKQLHEQEYNVQLTDDQARLYFSRLVNFVIAVLDKNQEIEEVFEDDSAECLGQ